MSSKSKQFYNAVYQRVEPERDITGTNFSNGPIVFKSFDTTSKCINLSKSYFRLQVKISDAAGNALDLSDKLAPSFLAPHTMFKSMYYRANNQVVSEVNDHYAQIAALSTRLFTTREQRNSLYGPQAFSMIRPQDRLKVVSNDTSLDLSDDTVIETQYPDAQTVYITEPRIESYVGFGIPGATTVSVINSVDETAELQFSAPVDIQAGDIVSGIFGRIYPDRYFIIADQGGNRYTVNHYDGRPALDDGATPVATRDLGIFRALSNTVTGINTSFDTTVEVGDKIRILNQTYRVSAVNSATNLTIDNPSVGVDTITAVTTDWGIIKGTNGLRNRAAATLDLMFQPALGIFQVDQWIVGHQSEICLYPQPKLIWKRHFMEDIGKNGKVPEVDYDIEILGLYFYPYVGLSEISPSSVVTDLTFPEIRCQMQPLHTSVSATRAYRIDRRANKITLALQDTAHVQDNILYPQTYFRLLERKDLDIKSLYMTVDKYMIPTPTWDLQYLTTSPGVDRLAQAYWENLHNSGQISIMPDFESYAEWKYLGPYYHWPLPTLPRDLDPQVEVTLSFNNNFNTAKPMLLVFDHFVKNFKMRAEKGVTTKVDAELHGR